MTLLCLIALFGGPKGGEPFTITLENLTRPGDVFVEGDLIGIRWNKTIKSKYLHIGFETSLCGEVVFHNVMVCTTTAGYPDNEAVWCFPWGMASHPWYYDPAWPDTTLPLGQSCDIIQGRLFIGTAARDRIGCAPDKILGEAYLDVLVDSDLINYGQSCTQALD